MRSALVQLGRETRSPAVVAVSDGAVEDLDLHAHEPTEGFGCYLQRMTSTETIDSRLGTETIRKQAGEVIAKRVAPAAPVKDGKQTPYRGHLC